MRTKLNHSKSLIRTASVCLLLSQTLLPGSAYASHHEDSSIDSTQMTLEELMETRIIKVVSASRYEQRVTEAPASVTVISADEIRKYGYRTLADVIRSVPGLYTSNDRNYSYLGIRGFNRPGDYNSRVLLLIDGHRLNDNIYDTAAIGTEFPLDIDLIDHIEFVRGPGSSLYGSNAFLGIINVFTRKTEDVSRELSVSGGSYNTWKGRVSYGKQFKSGVEVLLSGSILDSNGNKNIYYPEYALDPNGPSYRNNDYDRAKSFYSRFSLGDFTLSGIYHTREKGIPTGSYGTVFNSTPNNTSDDRGYADLAFKSQINEDIHAAARLYYDAYAYKGEYNYYDRVSGGLPYVVNLDKAGGRWWGAETTVTLTRLQDHKISVGGEFKGNLTGSQSNSDVSPYLSYLDDNHRYNSWGLFVQDEYRIAKTLLLSAGVRYDNYSSFDSINPRAALIYQPTAMTTLKLVYGEAFRAPNIYERFYNDGGNTALSNPGLKPEKIRTYEAIWEQYFGANFNSSLVGYYSRIDNLVTQVADPLGLLIFQNYEKVDTKGIEMALHGKWDNGLKGRLSYSWQETKIVETGERLHNSPLHLAKANISIPFYNNKQFISPELQYVSSRITIAGNRTRDIVLANLTLFSLDLIKDLDASISIYNLFDSNYGDPGGTEHLQDSIRQDGINFRCKLSYRF